MGEGERGGGRGTSGRARWWLVGSWAPWRREAEVGWEGGFAVAGGPPWEVGGRLWQPRYWADPSLKKREAPHWGVRQGKREGRKGEWAREVEQRENGGEAAAGERRREEKEVAAGGGGNGRMECTAAAATAVAAADAAVARGGSSGGPRGETK